MPRYIEEGAVYGLFDQSGRASLHVGDIDVLPRADVEPVIRAHWIEINPKKDVEGWIEYDYKCSACDEISWTGHNYCPNCGAKMDERS
jgi:hypothetical protein